MSEKNSPFFKGAIWIGLPFLLAGAAVIRQSILVGMADESTPRWIGIAFGLMFFNAGITLSLMDAIFNQFRDKKWFSYLHALAILSIPLIFPLLFNWVAFGPGKREFGISISIPFLTFEFDRANEIIGRIAFGIPALLMDAFLGYGMYGLVVERVGKKKADEL
ncbi:MAG: hypothetical protein HQ525_04710 [Anaerolineae bacterium]|nr:hypothetical protein [Anaerolineae bacterium]